MAASPPTNLCSTCRRFADVLQYDVLVPSNATWINLFYPGLEIEFEHGRPARAAAPPHRLCQRGGGSQEQYCFSSIACVQSACWSRHFIIDPRFSNMPSGWATASTMSLLYISGYYTSKHGNSSQLYSLQGKILRDHERERNLPITWMKAWTLKVPWGKLPHCIWLGVYLWDKLRFEPINLYVETCSHRITATMWRASWS